MIGIETIWLATGPIDMRAGVDTILARVIKVLGAARPHHAYLFANKHSTRMTGFCRTPNGTIVSFAATPGYETYRGLGWYGVICQRPA